MKKVFTAADRYIETSNWKTIAVLKFCLLALGIIIGMHYLYPAYGKILPYPERGIVRQFVPAQKSIEKTRKL